jgi:hypothetical protein
LSEPHRLGIGNARPGRGRHRLAAAELLERARDYRLDGGEHVLLFDEAHFEIELVEFAGQPVGARILVAKAGRDLEIAVEARHHQQLLVLLRRLRQRVERSGMDARGHQKIARAFRARRGKYGRREFVETLLFHAGAQIFDDRHAQHDVGVQLLLAQVEEAVFEPGFLGIGLIAEHRQRQFARRAEHLDLAHIDFDEAGGHVGILRAGGALAHLAIDPHDEFRAQRLRQPERRRVRIDDALRQAVMVAQVDEQQAAVVADAVTPAGEADRLAFVVEARIATMMGAVAVQGQCNVSTG